MKILFKKHILLFIGIALVTVILGTLAVLILPERFMFDAITISSDPYDEKSWLGGSYAFSMMLYHVTGLGKLPFPLVAIIQLPILFYLIYRLKVPRSFYQLTLKNAILWLGLLMFGFYVGFPSKEFITAIYIWLICLILISKKPLTVKMLYSTSLLIIFGLFYRQYFILVPFLAFGLYLVNLLQFKNRVLTLLCMGLFFASMMSLSYGLLKGEFMSQSSREALNHIRIQQGDENAATIVSSPVETDTFHGEVIGIVYGFFTINLPVTGLRFLLKPHVIAFVIWQLCLFIYLSFLYQRVLSNKSQYGHELWVFHLLFAYFIIQGIFEPDLGSAVKHKHGVFPLIWLAFYYNKDLIKRPEKIKKYVFKKAS